MKDLGHINVKEHYYSLGGQFVDPDRLELLTDDKSVMHMLNIARLNDVVHLYVVHNIMEPQIIKMIDWVDGHVHDEGDVATQVDEGQVVGDGQVEKEMVEGESEGHIEVEIEMGYGEGEGHAHTEVGIKMVDGQGDDVDESEDEDVHEVEDEDVDDDEKVDENVDDKEVDEAEDEDVSEESLVDVNIQCDIGASKGNGRQEPSPERSPIP
ncbi:glutamic acid-rich protein-like [Vigna radiata var. radiata]|uniref:Glutamic acid-rich protein-like n=1 Tax=Vigna radiata var. radiata TaxID=3916 RepID=A0A1S3UAK7_VIGRR|nr:glutamic acid-rich protein-like [Vigna radiata var. radiata]